MKYSILQKVYLSNSNFSMMFILFSDPKKNDFHFSDIFRYSSIYEKFMILQKLKDVKILRMMFSPAPKINVIYHINISFIKNTVLYNIFSWKNVVQKKLNEVKKNTKEILNKTKEMLVFSGKQEQIDEIIPMTYTYLT